MLLVPGTELPAEVGGGHAGLLAEEPAEIEGIVVADHLGDLRDVVVAGLQEALRGGDAQGDQVLGGGGACVLPEAPHEPADAEAELLRVRVHGDLLHVVGVEVADGLVHLPGHVQGPVARLRLIQPAEHDQEQAQAADAGLLVVGAALLQLLDHLLEDLAVAQGSAAVDHMLVVPEAVAAEDVRHAASGEVDPVDLGLIRAVIVVALLLPGTVEDHVARRHEMLLAAEIEVSLSGCHIQELKVHPSAGAVRRELGPGEQAVGPAAADEQGMLPVLEVDARIVPVGAVYIHIRSSLSGRQTFRKSILCIFYASQFMFLKLSIPYHIRRSRN